MSTTVEPEAFSQQTIFIETPKGSFVKRNEFQKIDFVSPIPSPFHYGRLSGFDGQDGDPLDAIWLGRITKERQYCGKVVGVVRFVDNGAGDNKVLLSDRALTPNQVQQLKVFFQLYAICKNCLVLIGFHDKKSKLVDVEVFDLQE